MLKAARVESLRRPSSPSGSGKGRLVPHLQIDRDKVRGGVATFEILTWAHNTPHPQALRLVGCGLMLFA
jgi:hypothetical protein